MARKGSVLAILLGIPITLILTGCNQKPASNPQAVVAPRPTPPQPPTPQGVGFRGGESQEAVRSRMTELGFHAVDCATPKGERANFVSCNFSRNEDEKVEIVFDQGALVQMTYTFGTKRFTNVLAGLKDTLGTPDAAPSDKSDWFRWCKDSEPSKTCHINVLLHRPRRDLALVMFILHPDANEDSKLTTPFPVPRLQTAAEKTEEEKEHDERVAEMRAALGDEIPSQVNTVGSDASNIIFNPALRNVKTFINRRNGTLSIYFDYDPTRSGDSLPSMRRFNFLIRLFDQNGQYLTHFQTDQIYMGSPSNPNAEHIAVCGGGPTSGCNLMSPAEVARLPIPASARLKRSGNFMQYQINLRDASYVAQAEFGAQPQ